MGHKCIEKLSYLFLTSCESLKKNCMVAETNRLSHSQTKFPMYHETQFLN